MKLTGYASIIGDTKPTFIDTTSETLVYEGYPSGSVFLICKIDLTTSIATRTYSIGAWDDRETLIYQ